MCGLSWGALVALRFALDHPARVRRVAVCAGFAYLPLPLRALQGLLAFGARDLKDAMRQGARFDVRSRLGTLRPPLLVLCGERDRVNRGLSRSLAAQVRGARHELIPGAGHVANVDNPEAFTTALARFLD